MQKMKMRDLSNNLTLAEGQDEYIRDCKVRNLREGTIKHWKDMFTNMSHYIDPDTPISDLDENIMPEFILAHRDKELSDMALYTYCRDLRTLLYFFMKQGWLREFKVEVPKCSKTPVETYTDEELSLLLKKPNAKAYANDAWQVASGTVYGTPVA
ncbi:MAG: phage integrase SAM-like domain-containing protein [Oscillospiraceae bacterium]|nr:phage integrase SAM-like domain-containing protein [Oscillospiraceae bacterium]